MTYLGTTDIHTNRGEHALSMKLLAVILQNYDF